MPRQRKTKSSRDRQGLKHSRMTGVAEPVAGAEPEGRSRLSGLQDAERRCPASFSLEQMLQLFAIAREKPEKYGRPISH